MILFTLIDSNFWHEKCYITLLMLLSGSTPQHPHSALTVCRKAIVQATHLHITHTLGMASKLPTTLQKQQANNDNIAAKGDNPVQESPLTNLRSRLPQELVDQIRNHFLDAALLPGYFFPQKSWGQESHAWNGKPSCRIARTNLLTLNKIVYEAYRHRVWTDNICVYMMRREEPKYCEIIIVKGHICMDLIGYEKGLRWLDVWVARNRQVLLRPSPTNLPQLSQLEPRNAPHDPPQLPRLDLDNGPLTIAFSDLWTPPGSRELLERPSPGEWSWPGLAEDFPGLREDAALIWSAFRRILKQTDQHHGDPLPEKANTCARSPLSLAVAKDGSVIKFCIFT